MPLRGSQISGWGFRVFYRGDSGLLNLGSVLRVWTFGLRAWNKATNPVCLFGVHAFWACGLPFASPYLQNSASALMLIKKGCRDSIKGFERGCSRHPLKLPDYGLFRLVYRDFHRDPFPICPTSRGEAGNFAAHGALVYLYPYTGSKLNSVLSY